MLFNKGVALCGTMMLVAFSGQAVAQTLIQDGDGYEDDARDSGVRLGTYSIASRVVTAPAKVAVVKPAVVKTTTPTPTPTPTPSTTAASSTTSKGSSVSQTAPSGTSSSGTSTPAIYSLTALAAMEDSRDSAAYLGGSFLSWLNIDSLRTLLSNLTGGLANLPAAIDTGSSGSSGTGSVTPAEPVPDTTTPEVTTPEVTTPDTTPGTTPETTEDPTRGPEEATEPATQTPTEVIKEVITDVVDTVTDVVSDIVDTVVDTVGDVVDTVVDAVTGGEGDNSSETIVTTPTLPETGTNTETTPSTSGSGTATPSAPAVAAGELPAVEKTFDVYDRTQLRAALVESLNLAGAIIRIHPGEYGSLVWTKRDHSKGRVYLIGATDEMPVFTMMNLGSSKNIAVSGVKVSGDDSVLVSLAATDDVVFSSSIITSANPNKDPWDNGNTGMHIRFASNITVQDITFEDLRLAVYLQRSTNIKIRYNTMHYLREGVNVAATDGLLLERNYFTEFYPRFNKGEHPDTIQFWNRNEEVGVYNAKLIENVMIHGGCRAVQGLFLGAERKGFPHKNLELRGNVYYGSSPHGITVAITNGLKIIGNVVAMSNWGERNSSDRSEDGRCSGGYRPKISATSSTDTQVYNNISMGTPATQDGSQLYNNWKIFDKIYGGIPWDEVFNGRQSDSPQLEDLVTRNGSAARAAGAGILQAFPYGDRKLGRILGLLDGMALHKVV